MKAVTSLYVDVGVLAALEKQAQTTGMSRNELIAGILEDFVQGPQKPLKPPKRLGVRAKAVLHAIEALTADYEALDPSDPARGNIWFPLADIGPKAGLYPSVALGGLRELEREGVVKSMMTPALSDIKLGIQEPPEMEHWRLAQERKP